MGELGRENQPSDVPGMGDMPSTAAARYYLERLTTLHGEVLRDSNGRGYATLVIDPDSEGTTDSTGSADADILPADDPFTLRRRFALAPPDVLGSGGRSYIDTSVLCPDDVGEIRVGLDRGDEGGLICEMRMPEGWVDHVAAVRAFCEVVDVVYPLRVSVGTTRLSEIDESVPYERQKSKDELIFELLHRRSGLSDGDREYSAAVYESLIADPELGATNPNMLRTIADMVSEFARVPIDVAVEAAKLALPSEDWFSVLFEKLTPGALSLGAIPRALELFGKNDE